ncbi:hypothetical protein RX331_12010 [Bradyrhizobium sp. BWA-3-5]|nr:hypothetical protein [Bradyrhizobium sp. BWA-3-5]WOH70093.1 hypothetical protein RX331_12010 [Bradyrhizobium sp. BWA-3-5]
MSDPASGLAQFDRHVGIVLDVGRTHQPPRANREFAHRPVDGNWKPLACGLGACTARGRNPQQAILVGEKDQALLAVKEMLDAGKDAFEYRVGISHRTADDTEDTGGSLLLLTREVQLSAQVRIFEFKVGLTRLRLIPFGADGFEVRLHLGDG